MRLFNHNVPCLITLLLVCLSSVSNSLLAQTPTDDPASSASDVADPYALPATDSVDELQSFIAKLSQIQPDSVAAYEAHLEKLPVALEEAAKRIMELDADPESDVYEQAEFLVMVAKVLGAQKLDAAGRSALVDEMAQRLDRTRRMGEEAGLASQLASAVLAAGERDEAIRAYQLFGEKIAATSMPDVAKLGQRLQGIATRLDLVGKPLALSGTLIDGSEFDPASVAGKYVLVDFWATWCGPCLRELPRLKDLQRAYGEDGFAIIGVSLDADRVRLEQYLEADSLPWPCLFQDEVGWDHPLALKLGIEGLPTTILIDREGKVVNVDIRAEELTKVLPELLGVAAKTIVSDQ